MAAEAENPNALPASATVDEAVDLMNDVVEAEHETVAAPVADDDADTPDGEPAEVELEADEPQAVDAGGAPEFWSAEDKAAWQAVPEGLRPVIAKYEQQRIAFVNEKTREAAQAREEAMRLAHGATGLVEQAAAWWQQNGPAFQQAFTDKWSAVDWNKLAEENPAEWARQKQQRDNEAALLADANRRGQADMAIARQRAEQAFQQARESEHAKLATRLPEYFAPEKAQRTYDELGNFLFSKGIPTERINAIHEAPIIELALSAMRFEQAQKRASTVTASSSSARTATANSAKTTPTRVAPGPASALGRTGNRNADAARQVGERFRKSGGASVLDAAELIRLNDL